MPTGYRGVIIAAFGLLVLGNAEQHRGQHQQHANQSKPTKPALIPKAPNAPRSEQSDKHCYGTSQPSLSCDAISAQAAIDQARDADKQAAAVWWQFGVGCLTLAAAVAAALYAKSAAHHTERGADAALKQVGISEDVSKKQLRAYLLVESLQALDFEIGKAGRVVLTFKNSGSTPAYKVKHSPTVDLYPMDVDEEHLVPTSREGVSESPIGPGLASGGHVNMSRFITERMMGLFDDGEAKFICFGRISYEDIWGVSHETGFRLRARADRPGPDGGFYMCSDSAGNYAT